MSAASPLVIQRDDAIKLCQELGLPGADAKPNAWLCAKLRSFPKPGVLEPENKPKTDRSKAVLADLLNAHSAEADISVEGEQASSPPKAKKPAKDKPTKSEKATKAPSSPSKASGKAGKGSGKPATKKPTGAKSASANGNGHAPSGKGGKKAGELSCIDAAAKVLASSKSPMSCHQMIEAMSAKGLWTSPASKRPANTLYGAILGDMARGKDSRFDRVGRGLFSARK